MNWDAIGAFGEIIGASAVVISVAYLAVQIRRQTDQARLAATREIAIAWNAALTPLIENQELTDLFLKSGPSYDALPNHERLRVSGMYMQMMRLLEQQYLHVREGNIDPTFFESADRTYLELLVTPGSQEWWARHKTHYSDGFRVLVDEQIKKAKAKGWESTYKAEREGSA